MSSKSVSSTELQTRAGQYIDEAAKGPVFITKHSRRVCVLVDITKHERLKEYDTRRTIYPHELSDDLAAELDKGYQGARNPDIDHLMK